MHLYIVKRDKSNTSVIQNLQVQFFKNVQGIIPIAIEELRIP